MGTQMTSYIKRQEGTELEDWLNQKWKIEKNNIKINANLFIFGTNFCKTSLIYQLLPQNCIQQIMNYLVDDPILYIDSCLNMLKKLLRLREKENKKLRKYKYECCVCYSHFLDKNDLKCHEKPYNMMYTNSPHCRYCIAIYDTWDEVHLHLYGKETDKYNYILNNYDGTQWFCDKCPMKFACWPKFHCHIQNKAHLFIHK